MQIVLGYGSIRGVILVETLSEKLTKGICYISTFDL